MPERRWQLNAFAGAVALGGAGVIAAAIVAGEADAMTLVVAMAVVAAVCELADFSPFPNSRVSLSVAAIIAAAVVSGLTGAAVVGTAAVGAQYVVRRKPLMKAAFNEGALLLSGFTVVLAFEAFGTGFRIDSDPVALAPALIGGAAYFAVNSALVAEAIALERRLNPVAVWRDAFGWLAPHYLLLALLGVGTATVYAAWGLAGVALPLALLAGAWVVIKQQSHRVERRNATA